MSQNKNLDAASLCRPSTSAFDVSTNRAAIRHYCYCKEDHHAPSKSQEQEDHRKDQA
jgi:hypothetical protein